MRLDLHPLRTAGHTIEIELSPLSDHPDHPTTGQAVRQVITAHRTLGLTPVVNFTGGTKLMSISAFAAANAEKAPNFYFDTTARHIHPGTTLALPAPLDSSATTFRLIAAQLSVSILTAAHGINHFIPGRDPAAWLPLSRLLAADPKLEQATHAFATTTLYEHNRRPEDYHRILETPIDDIPDALVEPLVDAYHIQLRAGHWHLAHPAADSFRRWAAGERYESH